MLSPSDISAFKAYIDALNLEKTTKSNYKTYVNWFDQFTPIDISSKVVFDEETIDEIAESIHPEHFDFNARRISDARTVLRHFRDFKDNERIESYQNDALIPFEAEELRRRVLVSIAQRRGQAEFRQLLIQRYGRCVVTGSDFEDVLEAAHIVAYASDGEMIVSNGLLLRADIHVLFDLSELSINPETQTIYCSPRLQLVDTYRELHLKRVFVPIREDTLPTLKMHFKGRKKV